MLSVWSFGTFEGALHCLQSYVNKMHATADAGRECECCPRDECRGCACACCVLLPPAVEDKRKEEEKDGNKGKEESMLDLGMVMPGVGPTALGGGGSNKEKVAAPVAGSEETTTVQKTLLPAVEGDLCHLEGLR